MSQKTTMMLPLIVLVVFPLLTACKGKTDATSRTYGKTPIEAKSADGTGPAADDLISGSTGVDTLGSDTNSDTLGGDSTNSGSSGNSNDLIPSDDSNAESSGSFAYEFNDKTGDGKSCTTGKRSFNSLRAMCNNLLDPEKNNDCALNDRIGKYSEECM